MSDHGEEQNNEQNIKGEEEIAPDTQDQTETEETPLEENQENLEADGEQAADDKKYEIPNETTENQEEAAIEEPVGEDTANEENTEEKTEQPTEESSEKEQPKDSEGVAIESKNDNQVDQTNTEDNAEQDQTEESKMNNQTNDPAPEGNQSEEQHIPEQPASEQPASEQPGSEQPAMEEPASEQPETEQPAMEEPASEQPETEQPTSEQPQSELPASEQPESEQPSSEQPQPEQQSLSEQISNKQESEQPKEDIEQQDQQEIQETEEDKPAAEQIEDGQSMSGDGKTPVETENMGTETEQINQGEPTADPMYNRDATATVKVLLTPSGQVTTLRCMLSQTITELKDHFSAEHKLPIDVLQMMCEGNQLDNKSTVADLGVGPNGTIQLELFSNDPENQPIKILKPRQEYTMPDVITVRVQSGNATKDIVVEIERLIAKKPFLGGYRHKNTNVEYHHASCQTAQKPIQVSNVERFCRDTQTVQQRHNVQQTANNTATQMTGIGVFISNMEDKLVSPGKYTTADDHHSMILNKVIIIQKYYRRWLAQCYVSRVKMDKEEREEWERQEELKKKQEKERRIRHEYERRMNPKSKQDFDLLYHALEKWRLEEVERIDAELSGAERKAALSQLLDQETQLIASIGRHKIDADTENKRKSIQYFLDKAAAPKSWKGPDGKLTEMDTPYTIRAQELRDIYNSINMKYLTQDERLDALLTLKHTVKEHDCKLTQEILELIDREAELLMRGVKESNLEGLRKRISTLFLQYIKTPTFNPEAARLLKVPQDPSALRKDIYFCPSCSQYKASTEFRLSSNSRAVGKCRKCLNTDNDARIRQDYSHYRYMLKEIRVSEQNFADNSKIAFLLQESDLRHLVENVWSAQSALSAWNDLYDLTLVRWDRHEHWSPWNCVLLTKEEASAHEKLQNMDEAYEKKFVLKVQNRHTLAKKHFARLPIMADHMKSRAASEASQRAPSIMGKGLSAQAARA